MAGIRAEGFGVFATTNIGPFNLLTALVTRSWIVHVGVLFSVVNSAPRKPQPVVYYEAQFCGFVGPRPFARLYRWAAARPYRRLHIRWLNLPAGSAEQKRLIAEQMVADKIGYDKVQCVRNWLNERLRLAVPRDPSRVHCSEAVTLLCRPEYELTDERRPNADSVTPASAWRKLNLLIKQRA